ncbi:glycosyltransferase family 2 protein [Enterococcus sp. AZ109]|uniref:glycosyltransferase family 2 protein n=1 Tax=Enterococcus sp. AZ109 TaxID=2774634 RepID=UPI003F28C7EF
METSGIKVSVIVPIYNTCSYLEACLTSLVQQTLKEIELILINDGSTDGSQQVIETFVERFPEKMRVFNQDNKGQAYARNLGLVHAKGDYIGFVDSDDVVAVGMFEQMYEAAVNTQADMVECDYKFCKVVEGVEYPLRKYGKVHERKKLEDLFIDPLVSPWNKLYRRKIIQQAQVFFPEGLIYEDTAFYMNLLPWIKKTAFVNTAYVTHYSRDNSTQTIHGNPKVGDMLTIIEGIVQYYQNNHFWEKYSLELEYFCVKILLCSCLGRMSSLGDKATRKENMQRITALISDYFPNYRKNPKFKAGLQNNYIKMCNPWTIPFFAFLSGKVYQWKMTKIQEQ